MKWKIGIFGIVALIFSYIAFADTSVIGVNGLTRGSDGNITKSYPADILNIIGKSVFGTISAPNYKGPVGGSTSFLNMSTNYIKASKGIFRNISVSTQLKARIGTSIFNIVSSPTYKGLPASVTSFQNISTNYIKASQGVFSRFSTVSYSRTPTVFLASQTVTGSPATTITFTGLDINTHKEYIVEVYHVPNGSIDNQWYLFYNNLTTQTDYRMAFSYQETNGGGSGQANNAVISNALGGEFSYTKITARVSLVNGFATTEARGSYLFATATRIMSAHMSQSYKAGGLSNITRLDFTAVNANAFGVGTKINIYKRN